MAADETQDFVQFWAVPVYVIATMALWFVDRPGAAYRWKLACLSGLSAAGVGLFLSQIITQFWQRPRPFIAHPSETFLLVAPSHEPSFPSDHAVAAFAIAFTVMFLGRRMGALFLATATIVAVSRVFVGLHYPGDVVGGALIGLAAAWIVFRFGGRRFTPIIRRVSYLTDPLVRPLWNALDRRRERPPLRPAAR